MVLAAGNCLAGEKLNLQDEKDRISYSIGYQVGNDFKQEEIDIRPDVLIKGIQAAMDESEPRMSPEEMRATLEDLQRRLSAAMEQKMKEAAAKNLAEGNAYLAENARKDGVKTLPSGLQYSIISVGNGKTPGPADVVEVNYRGTLISGTEFDSSFKHGKPAKFKADKVIKGWAEALHLMKTGGKWRLFIPPELAYGDRQTGEIGPNSTLIFDIELLAVHQDTGKTQRK
ncbi:MAG: FKBP-type peptidyl-prolyl cis-trans isomerase N-terminal domain-containing protein [Desulfobulbaceae bacterium]